MDQTVTLNEKNKPFQAKKATNKFVENLLTSLNRQIYQNGNQMKHIWYKV